jgi:hypothetical protein
MSSLIGSLPKFASTVDATVARSARSAAQLDAMLRKPTVLLKL